MSDEHRQEELLVNSVQSELAVEQIVEHTAERPGAQTQGGGR
jgi:hypothetical protein